MIELVRAGGLATVQDLGRPGWAHLGVPPSGAADPQSLQLANRLVGNEHAAAALELTLRGPRLRFGAGTVVALTGAAMPGSFDGARPLPLNSPRYVRAGQTLELGTASGGVRSYLAVRGGIDVPAVLGSRATDLLTGLGPAPLRVGDAVAIGSAAGPMPGVDLAPVAPRPSEPVLGVVLGPRADWFAASALERLASESFAVGSRSDRIGVRLEGVALEPDHGEQLASEGVVTGAIQVPPSGDPILLLTDHPTTGGYPVIAVVAEADLAAAGQLRPGQRVRFKPLPARARPPAARRDHSARPRRPA